MGQKYKFFINGKLLYLVRNPAGVDDILSTDRHFIIRPFRENKDFDKLMDILLGDVNPSSMILYGPDPEAIFHKVCGRFTCIDAAGGVVRHTDGRVLLIHRRGFWDLPKGKPESGETIEETALREVEEETGLTGLRLGTPVELDGFAGNCTYHSYQEAGETVLKASHWYHMETDFEGTPQPQEEEGITEVRWVAPEELPRYYPEMYPSVVDVLQAAVQANPAGKR